MIRAANQNRCVFGERRGLKVFESIDFGEFGNHHVNLTRACAVGQFLPRGDDEAHPQSRVQAIQPPDNGADKRRAAERADTNSQLAQIKAFGQSNFAIKIA